MNAQLHQPMTRQEVLPLCRNRRRCAQLALHQRQVLPAAIALHEAFLLHVPHSIVGSEHAVARIAERGFTYDEVVSVVECCEPVEWRDFRASVDRVEHTYGELATRLFKLRRYCIRIKGETFDGRPLIVVCRYGDQPLPGMSWEMHVITAYDPSDHAHQWAAGYTHRTCFCGGGDEEERPRGIEAMLLAARRANPLLYTSEPCL